MELEFIGPLEQRRNYDLEVRDAAEKYGVDPDLAVAVHRTEYDPKRWVSYQGAIGPMQLLPETAERFSVDPNDPRQNAEGGVQYLKFLLSRYDNNVEQALMAYHAGEGNMDSYLAGRPSGVGPKTMVYPRKVLVTLGRISSPAEARAESVPEDEFEYLGPLDEEQSALGELSDDGKPRAIPANLQAINLKPATGSVPQGDGYLEYLGPLDDRPESDNAPFLSKLKAGASALFGDSQRDPERLFYDQVTNPESRYYNPFAPPLPEGNLGPRRARPLRPDLREVDTTVFGIPGLGSKQLALPNEPTGVVENLESGLREGTAHVVAKLLSLFSGGTPEAAQPEVDRRAQYDDLNKAISRGIGLPDHTAPPGDFIESLARGVGESGPSLMEALGLSYLTGGAMSPVFMNMAAKAPTLFTKIFPVVRDAVTFGAQGALEPEDQAKQGLAGVGAGAVLGALSPYGRLTRGIVGAGVGAGQTYLLNPEASGTDLVRSATLMGGFAALGKSHGQGEEISRLPTEDQFRSQVKVSLINERPDLVGKPEQIEILADDVVNLLGVKLPGATVDMIEDRTISRAEVGRKSQPEGGKRYEEINLLDPVRQQPEAVVFPEVRGTLPEAGPPIEREIPGVSTQQPPAVAMREAAGRDLSLDEQAHEAATSPMNDLPEPTQGQKEAGNYKKGHARIHGLDISIENPKGSVRSGIGENGEPWENVSPAHYGYIRKTVGKDGDHVDVYVGDNPESRKVFLVDQINPATGRFDEHKSILGVDTRDEAIQLYNDGFDDNSGPKRMGAIHEMSVDGFKNWLDTGNTKKPFGYKESTARQQNAPLRIEPHGKWSIAVKGPKAAVMDGRIASIPDTKPVWNSDIEAWVFPKGQEPKVREALQDLLGGPGKSAEPKSATSSLKISPHGGQSIIVIGAAGDQIGRLKSIPGTKPIFNRDAGGYVFPKAQEGLVRKALADITSGSVVQMRGGGPSTEEIVSGVKKFAEQDVIPSARKVAQSFAASGDDIKRIFAPASRGEAARETGGILREHLAEQARKSDVAEHALRTAERYFDAQPSAKRLEFIHNIETGRGQVDRRLQKAADTLRAMLDQRVKDVRALGTGKLQNVIENYFPHIWEDQKKAKSFIAGWYAKRPIEGSKAFLKKRSVPTVREGIANDLKPVTDNPITLTRLKLREMDKYVTAHKVLNEAKKRGLARFVRSGKVAPEGWEKINDKIGTVFGRSAQNEMVIRGSYYMPEPAARVINNYLGPGLREQSTMFRGYLTAANIMNQVQLGMSAFHLGFTSLDAMISKFSLGVMKAVQGDVAGAGKSILGTPFAAVTNAMTGHKVLKEWFQPGSQSTEIQKIVKGALAGGARAKMDDFYRTHITRNMLKAFKEGNVIGGMLRLPFAAVELQAKPILEWIVPRQKMGVFADLMKMEIERKPNMSHEELRNTAGRIWDSVDNRMGQLVYDNLFWKKAAKDIGMASVRSLGWNLGTWREVGGGVIDTAKAARKAATLKKPEMTYRMSYIVGLPLVVGTFGAMTNFLMTGEAPQDLKDYFFPRTGRLDPNGNPERMSLPSYMKDLYHISTDATQTAINKLHPLLHVAGEMLQNKDFYGTKIRNEDDPLVQQGLDLLKHVGKSFEPFAIRNIRREVETAGKLEPTSALPFIGVTPAPMSVNQSPAERLLSKIMREKMPVGARTREEAERSEMKKNVSRALRTGDADRAAETLSGMAQKGLLKRSDLKDIKERAGLPPIVAGFKHLDAEDAVKVWAKANDDERALLLPLMKRKLEGLKDTYPERYMRVLQSLVSTFEK